MTMAEERTELQEGAAAISQAGREVGISLDDLRPERPIPTARGVPWIIGGHGGGLYGDFHRERIRAHEKHAPRGKSCEQMDWTDRDWLPVLTEEVGEVARALCDREPSGRLREELVQVGAMAAAWINSIDHAPKMGQPSVPETVNNDAEHEA